jgi:hypothetical protein
VVKDWTRAHKQKTNKETAVKMYKIRSAILVIKDLNKSAIIEKKNENIKVSMRKRDGSPFTGESIIFERAPRSD